MGRKNLGVHTLKPSLRDPVKTFQSQISDKLYYCCALVKAVRAIYNTLLIKHWHFIIKSDIFYRSLQLFLADIALVGLFYFKNQNLHICVLKNLGLHTIHRVMLKQSKVDSCTCQIVRLIQGRLKLSYLEPSLVNQSNLVISFITARKQV